MYANLTVTNEVVIHDHSLDAMGFNANQIGVDQHVGDFLAFFFGKAVTFVNIVNQLFNFFAIVSFYHYIHHVI